MIGRYPWLWLIIASFCPALRIRTKIIWIQKIYYSNLNPNPDYTVPRPGTKIFIQNQVS